MPTYLITNRVPGDFTPSAGNFAAWTAWFESLGASLEDRGNPAFDRRTLGNCGPDTVLGGYTLLTAPGLEAAAALAAGHPLLTRGGGVEIGELTPLNLGSQAAGSGTPAVAVSVHIAAPPQRVFGYLTDAARYVEWMGCEALLEPVPGGVYRVAMRDGFAAAGTFTEVEPARRIAFTWGWDGEEAAQRVLHAGARQGGGVPAGSTRVVVTLDEDGGGTRLALRHDGLPSPELRDAHQAAWQAYLGRLAVVAAGGDPGPDPHS